MTRSPQDPPRHIVHRVVRLALDEDLGTAGDITTAAIISPQQRSKAEIVARAPGILAGLGVGLQAFALLDPHIEIDPVANDGDRVEPDTALATIEGPTTPILAAERTCLNLIARLSSIATATRHIVDLVAHTKATIVDTRKTTPGLRVLEKYAVRIGGGTNHRFGLYDAVLIKDNHLAAMDGIRAAVKAARSAIDPCAKIEVEVDDLAQLDTAIAAGADAVLLDNMTIDELTDAVSSSRGQVVLEASGGITKSNVVAVAETGVDLISIGALTHSASNWDVALDFHPA